MNETEEMFTLDSAQPSTSAMKCEIPDTTQVVNLDNVQDFSNVCRMCATITEFVIPIFTGEGLQNNLADKIHKHLPIKVLETDLLPQVVCYQCASTLLAWHELVACCHHADEALRARLAADTALNTDKVPKASNAKSSPTIEDDAQSKEDLHIKDETDDLSDQSDNEPLSTMTTKKSLNYYNNFYNALVNFRNHFEKQHVAAESYPDFTDSSVSEVEENNEDNFDDLTQFNMRKDRMNDDTRQELSQVRNKINGKVFYMCSICNKNLSSPHTYLWHTRIHTGEKPCVCHKCGKQFRSPSALQRHLTQTHERMGRYSCSICPKTFANAQNLKHHLRIHTGEKPFVCSHCGRRFTQNATLYLHLKTHSAQFPFNCLECGAKFRVRSGLARHKLQHTGERPYVCAQCGKGFRRGHDLNNHMLSHSNIKPHTCAVCGATFRLRRALRNHLKRIHEDHTSGQSNSINYNNVEQY